MPLELEANDTLYNPNEMSLPRESADITSALNGDRKPIVTSSEKREEDATIVVEEGTDSKDVKTRGALLPSKKFGIPVPKSAEYNPETCELTLSLNIFLAFCVFAYFAVNVSYLIVSDVINVLCCPRIVDLHYH